MATVKAAPKSATTITSTKGLCPTTKLGLTASGKRYTPASTTAQNNQASWQLIQKTLTTAKKPVSVGQLQKALKAAHNHAPYVNYCIRRGWLGQA
jgi:hypothetical protein